VSVGENPWNEAGPVHLGELCREFGGGGRRAAAGVPMSSVKLARELAAHLAERLNEALHSKNDGSDAPVGMSSPALTQIKSPAYRW